jgi:hypothetical protein
MTETPENPTLILLRRLDDKTDRLLDDMREVKSRLGLLGETAAGLSRRVDRLEGRLEPVERRLDLVETS